MNLPAAFPEGTVFLDVEGLPVTAIFPQNIYLDWEDRNAAEPRPLSFDEIKGKGKAITEATFRALVHQCHTRALPGFLLKATKEFEAYQQDHAELHAQGLPEDEIRRLVEDRQKQRRGQDPDMLTVRTISAAKRRAKP